MGEVSYSPVLAFIPSKLSTDLDLLSHCNPSFLEINSYIPGASSATTNFEH